MNSVIVSRLSSFAFCPQKQHSVKKPSQFMYPADCGHRNKTLPIVKPFALVAFILRSWTERKSIQPSTMTCSGCVMIWKK